MNHIIYTIWSGKSFLDNLDQSLAPFRSNLQKVITQPAFKDLQKDHIVDCQYHQYVFFPSEAMTYLFYFSLFFLFFPIF